MNHLPLIVHPTDTPSSILTRWRRRCPGDAAAVRLLQVDFPPAKEIVSRTARFLTDALRDRDGTPLLDTCLRSALTAYTDARHDRADDFPRATAFTATLFDSLESVYSYRVCGPSVCWNTDRYLLDWALSTPGPLSVARTAPPSVRPAGLLRLITPNPVAAAAARREEPPSCFDPLS